MRYLQEVRHDRFILILATAKKRAVVCTDELGVGGDMRNDTHRVRWPRGQKVRRASHRPLAPTQIKALPIRVAEFSVQGDVDVLCFGTDEWCAQSKEHAEKETTTLVTVEDAVALRKDGPFCSDESALQWNSHFSSLDLVSPVGSHVDKAQAFVSICMASLGGMAGNTLSGAGGGGAAVVSWLFTTPFWAGG